MKVIVIMYLICLIPAIIFTRFGLKEGIMTKYGYPGKITFFLSVWLITPAFFLAWIVRAIINRIRK